MTSPDGEPLGDALETAGSSSSVIVIDSGPTGSRAGRINRGNTPTELNCVTEPGTHDNGVYAVTFRGYSEYANPNAPAVSVIIESIDGNTALQLNVRNGAYELITGDGAEILASGYTVETVQEIKFIVDFNENVVSMDIDNTNMATGKPFLESGFSDISRLIFQIPASILEAFPANYVADDITVCQISESSEMTAK